MTESHKNSNFIHSCLKMPTDPCNRQSNSSNKYPSRVSPHRCFQSDRQCQYSKDKHQGSIKRQECGKLFHYDGSLLNYQSLLEFVKNAPDYEEVCYLSNEQFKHKLDQLKRRQRRLMKNLLLCLEKEDVEEYLVSRSNRSFLTTSEFGQQHRLGDDKIQTKKSSDYSDSQRPGFVLKGSRCNLQSATICSPNGHCRSSAQSHFSSRLTTNMDLLNYNR